MIYTITLNPTLDRNLWIEKVLIDDSNRVQKLFLIPMGPR